MPCPHRGEGPITDVAEFGTHRRVRVDGVNLHLVEAVAGAPVVFLNGFPVFWYSWQRQPPAVAAVQNFGQIICGGTKPRLPPAVK